ncbi:hypothetical protein NX059_005495 [Plenodomus lindquistii]|nr:hypothetical protein NX059_005495 [Plenodomus lindquistii]
MEESGPTESKLGVTDELNTVDELGTTDEKEADDELEGVPELLRLSDKLSPIEVAVVEKLDASVEVPAVGLTAMDPTASMGTSEPTTWVDAAAAEEPERVTELLKISNELEPVEPAMLEKLEIIGLPAVGLIVPVNGLATVKPSAPIGTTEPEELMIWMEVAAGEEFETGAALAAAGRPTAELAIPEELGAARIDAELDATEVAVEEIGNVKLSGIEVFTPESETITPDELMNVELPASREPAAVGPAAKESVLETDGDSVPVITVDPEFTLDENTTLTSEDELRSELLDNCGPVLDVEKRLETVVEMTSVLAEGLAPRLAAEIESVPEERLVEIGWRSVVAVGPRGVTEPMFSMPIELIEDSELPETDVVPDKATEVTP